MTWKQTTFELNHENPNYKMRKLCLDSVLSIYFVDISIFQHSDVKDSLKLLFTGNIKVITIELYNDCIVVIAHPYHGNVVFIVHFYIITTFMLPPGQSSDIWYRKLNRTI